MIISRTPLRISFVGGGTDLPAFYQAEPGAVIATAINKYIYIAVNDKFDHRIRASYSITEIVDEIDELNHELIREGLKLAGIDGGIEITSISDIPSEGTGLGSSSSYTVGLLNAFHAYKGRHAGAERLAAEACIVELEKCQKPIGKQDQYIAAYGGLQHIRFNQDESVHVDPVICTPDLKEELHSRLMLFFTGVTRSSSSILKEQSANTHVKSEARASLRRMTEMVDELLKALRDNDLTSFGEILHESWMEKKQMAAGVATPQIDDWYERARRSGAIGGKILGAGGGGFLLLYAPTDVHQEIVKALPELRLVPFRFEAQGSKIIYVEESV